MKKLLFVMIVVLGSVAALQLFPGERRARLKERWREIEEQNKLLRKQNKILQEATSAGESQG